jgi:hypothetical protein
MTDNLIDDLGNYNNGNVNDLPQSQSSQNATIVDIVNSSKTQYDYLSNNINIGSLYNNINQEILLKQEQLLKLENEKINNQLFNLEQVQSIITNKDRMTRQTEEELNKKNKNINFLIFMFIIALIALIVIVIHYQGLISYNIMSGILIGLFIISLLTYFYYANVFYLGTALKNIFGNREKILIDKLDNWKFGENIKNAIDTQVYGSESEWINNNCGGNCSTPVTDEENSDVAMYSSSISRLPTPGYYYNDGTAPPQLLYPPPSNTSKEQIYWPDMDNTNIKNNYNIEPQNTLYDTIGSNNNGYSYTANL